MLLADELGTFVIYVSVSNTGHLENTVYQRLVFK